MKLNEKGVTIIEVLLGTVLFSIVALSITFFISTGTKTCHEAEMTVKVQEEAQVVSNQLIAFTEPGNCVQVKEDTTSGDVRYAVFQCDKADGKAKDEYIIYFKKSSQQLYFYEITSSFSDAQKTAIRSEITGATDVKIGQLLGEYVKEFDVQIRDNSITFHVTYELDGKIINISNSVSLRNRWVDVTTPIVSIE